jgi:uncharacterized protein YkwD
MTIEKMVPPVNEIIPMRRGIGNTIPDPAWGSRNTSFESKVLQLVNEHRTKQGLATLGVEAKLHACAGWKSLHMTGYSYMQHDDPDPPVARGTWTRFADFGLSGGNFGENIAYGYTTPEAVMTGWLNSPGHKANIEGAAFKSIGIGAALKPEGTWAWCQCFGSIAGEPAPEPPLPPPAPTKLSFTDRHAIGIIWNAKEIPTSRVNIQVWSGSAWTIVREQANSGSSFLTFPFDHAGEVRVRVVSTGSVAGAVFLEGTFTVKPVRFK